MVGACMPMDTRHLVLNLHVYPINLAPLEDDITDLTAEVQHKVQHARGCETMGLLELMKLFSMLGSIEPLFIYKADL